MSSIVERTSLLHCLVLTSLHFAHHGLRRRYVREAHRHRSIDLGAERRRPSQSQFAIKQRQRGDMSRFRAWGSTSRARLTALVDLA